MNPTPAFDLNTYILDRISLVNAALDRFTPPADTEPAFLDVIADSLQPTEVEEMQHLLDLPGEQDNLRRVVEASLARLRRRDIDEEMHQLFEAIKAAPDTEKNALIQRRLALKREREAL